MVWEQCQISKITKCNIFLNFSKMVLIDFFISVNTTTQSKNTRIIPGFFFKTQIVILSLKIEFLQSKYLSKIPPPLHPYCVCLNLLPLHNCPGLL